MKGKFGYLTLLVLLLSLASCDSGNNDDGDPIEPPPPGTFSLKVNDLGWTANLGAAANIMSGVISVSGSASDGKRCNITLYNVTSTGTYQIGGTSTNAAQWISGPEAGDIYETQFGGGTGSITVIVYSVANIAGSFHFTAQNPDGDEVVISEGLFNVLF